jgi:hypothetical protein
MVSNTLVDNSERWENEGGLPLPADDSNFDNLKTIKIHDHEIWSNEQGIDDEKPTIEELEDNAKAAIRKKDNVVKLENVDWSDDDWYHGC